jgi:hypothetical protein
VLNRAKTAEEKNREMKLVSLLAAAAIAASQLQAQCPAIEYTLSKDGIGPFTMKTCVVVKGKQATFTGTARNDSGQAIRQASWCVLAPKQESGCAFTPWTIGPLPPGQTLNWNITGPAGRGLPKHTVVLSRVSPVTKLDSVRKLYVEQIDGGNGPMSRDQLKALIANSGRFEPVEDTTSADAVLKGRSETRDVASAFQSSERSGNVGVVLGIGGTQISGANGKSDSQSRTETIVAESLVLRLVLPSGESIWAWDDTKSCDQAKAACAIADMVAVAVK